MVAAILHTRQRLVAVSSAKSINTVLAIRTIVRIWALALGNLIDHHTFTNTTTDTIRQRWTVERNIAAKSTISSLALAAIAIVARSQIAAHTDRQRSVGEERACAALWVGAVVGTHKRGAVRASESNVTLALWQSVEVGALEATQTMPRAVLGTVELLAEFTFAPSIAWPPRKVVFNVAVKCTTHTTGVSTQRWWGFHSNRENAIVAGCSHSHTLGGGDDDFVADIAIPHHRH